VEAHGSCPELHKLTKEVRTELTGHAPLKRLRDAFRLAISSRPTSGMRLVSLDKIFVCRPAYGGPLQRRGASATAATTSRPTPEKRPCCQCWPTCLRCGTHALPRARF
jgi:hypothetical protein